MADSIVRLKVDSQEYDNKLKRAAEGIQRYADGCRKAGGTLTQLDDGVEQFVKELGKMETVSNSARGKISEMTKAFTDLSVQYNKLTEEEKNSPFGRALAESLNTLKGRIKDGNTELKNISTSLNDTGGVMGMLKDKLTVNIDAMKLFSVGLQAAKAALDVAKDAFFASEASVDEWGRVMESSKSLYEGFLTALNTGDISGYLSRIDEIVTAARKAYDELDRLGTMKTIQAPAISSQQTENERFRMMIQTRRYIAPTDGRAPSPGMKSGQLLTDAQVKVLERQLQNGMQSVVGLISNEVKQSTRAIDAVYTSQAKDLGLSVKEFRKGTSSMAEFDKRIAGYNRYLEFERQHTTYDERSGISHRDKAVNPDEMYKAWGVFRVDGDRFNRLVQLIQQRDQQASQSYSMQSQAYRAINRAEGISVRGGSGGGGGRSGGGGGRGSQQTVYAEGSIAWQEQEVQRLTKAWKEAGDAVRDDYAVQLSYAKQRLAEMTGGFAPEKMKDISGQSANLTQGAEITVPAKLEIKSPVEQWQAEIKRLQELIGQTWDSTAIDVYTQKIDQLNEKINDFSHTSVKGGESSSKAWSSTASAISSVGSAINAIDDPTAKIIGLVAQGIASVVSATGIATEKAAGQSRHWAEYLAAAASITAQMIATISQIHSASGYAQGGIVKGNSYSGDNIPADTFVNAGELILNKSQQGAIASQLQNPGGNLRVTGVLRGEDLLISIDKSARRQGRGELVFWKNQ